MAAPKRYRKEDDVSYTLGMTLTLELLARKPETINRVFLHSTLEMSPSYKKLISLCQKHGIEVLTNDKAFLILSQKENCYVIGEFRKYTCQLAAEKSHVVLVNPSNAGNLGTILRSCVGFDTYNLAIIRPGVDIFDPKAIRASMGAIFHMQFAYFDSYEEYRIRFPNHAQYPFMLQAALPIQGVEFILPFSLIFGNEATGLPEDFLAVGQSVVIPHTDSIDSLNLPIAVSIALYASTRISFDSSEDLGGEGSAWL